MSIMIDVKELSQRLSELLAQVAQGDEVIATDGEVPCARLTGITATGPRIPGLHRGAVTFIADDFDAELPDEFWFGKNETPA